MPHILSFATKREYFKSQLKDGFYERHGALRLSIRRNEIFEDTFNQIITAPPARLKVPKTHSNSIGEAQDQIY